MEIGVAIPNGVPGVEGPALIEWARRVESNGFSTVGVIGRIAYPVHEELVTLAAVAGATQRVRLMPTVLIAPVREPVLLAKQAATLDRLSNGRLVLGLGVGMRADDFVATGTTFEDRGNRFDQWLETVHAVWRGDPAVPGSHSATPPPVRGTVPMYFGTLTDSPRVMHRIAKWGDGYIAVGSPQMVAPIVDALEKARQDEGRPERLKLQAANYFAFGDDAIADGERNIHDYYDDFYPWLGNAAAAAMARTPEQARTIMNMYRDAGFDEFNFSAASTDPAQVDMLAEAVL